jgi:excisionase family DNA binding protein
MSAGARDAVTREPARITILAGSPEARQGPADAAGPDDDSSGGARVASTVAASCDISGRSIVDAGALAHELGVHTEVLVRFLEDAPRLVEVDGHMMVQRSGRPRPVEYSPAEAAAVLGTSLATIYRHMEAGRLRFTQLPMVQAQRRISREDLLAFILRRNTA